MGYPGSVPALLSCHPTVAASLMPITDPRRELLICLAVLENGLSDAERLLPVLRAWIDRPEQSLATLLVEQQAITSEQGQHLLSLVQSRLADHQQDHDAVSMWATVSQPGSGAFTSTKVDSAQGQDAAHQFDETRQHTSTLPAPIVDGRNDERFSIVNSYAQGALGEVFIAHDQQLGRMVALKQIKSRWADDSEARARFLLEAQITGRLEHPGVVPVYALGFDASGRPHYAMRFIEGESLLEVVARFHKRFCEGTARCGERLLELRKLLSRFVTVCQTIDYAHSRGILHRDVKPANIMVGKYGETLVVDWGLAKIIGGGGHHQIMYQEIVGAEGLTPTAKGTAVGTPAYMSPEQAVGDIDELSPRTDVYSLGVTLYHILTGRLPHEEGSVSGVIEQIKKETALAPCKHCSWVPRPLESICLKAMAARTSDRYPSAAALAEDVERWLADEPVLAHTPSFAERVRRWLRRRY